MSTPELYAALYGSQAQRAAKSLVSAADDLHEQLTALADAPSRSRAAEVLVNLAGAQRAVERLAETLPSEEPANADRPDS